MGMARLLVIGGGIAGTAAALALSKAGRDVTVYEAHPDSAEDIGAFLTLASNGLRALAQIDATPAVTAIGFPLTSMRVVDHTGAEVARVPLGEADDPRLRYRCLRRGELNAALQAEAARRGVEIVHGTRLASVQDGPEGVTAHFTDGSTATGDLLIGADGLNSTVRRTTAPTARPGYAGQRVFYGCTGTAPDPGTAPTDGEAACITMVRGSTAAFGHTTSPDGETFWFARVAADAPLTAAEISEATPTQWRDLLVPLLRKDPTPAADIVAATTAPVLVTNATEMPNGTPWRSGRSGDSGLSGRTLLIGDAAHAASPATGQGASMALEDAVILAKCLRDSPDVESALPLYETLRRPRVEHNTTVSGNLSRGVSAPPPAQASGGRPAEGRPAGGRPTGGAPASRPGDDELIRQLDWNSGIG
ncbi:FAD-dependent monooxygenase [Streptomyces sp. NBC_01275]|uniref:FAD-dependent oxidoreductase n=1 Tax=Streptomyces sp. NBC_01275 TaxID=2903807 RepID=UPI00225BB4EE|nr:NAD(P)/FAD-dependent oxidoreductase [Streptomyces sp. NBC_01275]MCX4761730.1 FAD-dependent monooxygenase [Streptomyces sp. NBC_01275]